MPEWSPTGSVIFTLAGGILTANVDPTKVALVTTQGSNANGRWVRFADGTQICYGSHAAAGVSISIASGGGFRSGTLSQPLPQAFLPGTAVAIVNDTGTNTLLAKHIGTLTDTISFLYYRVASATVDVQANYIAIGRWQ